jgi:tetratricopeptide (TPR) repeat protein
MGLIYKDQDDYSQAIACYRSALQRELKDRAVQDVLVELAECLVRTAEFSQALDVLGRCKPAAADSPQVLTLKGECLQGLGRASEARSLLDQVLSRARTPDALRRRAQLHLEAGEAKEAAGLLEEALQRDAGDFNSRYQLALAYEQLGRRAEAAEQRRRWQQNQEDLAQLSKLSRLAQEKPWDADTRRRLAEICTKLDKPDLARLWQAAASACPPGGGPRSSQP